MVHRGFLVAFGMTVVVVLVVLVVWFANVKYVKPSFILEIMTMISVIKLLDGKKKFPPTISALQAPG